MAFQPPPNGRALPGRDPSISFETPGGPRARSVRRAAAQPTSYAVATTNRLAPTGLPLTDAPLGPLPG